MTALIAALVALAFAAPSVVLADVVPVRRFAVIVGANRGAPDRVPLRYAIADAERFAAVVTRMGGVQPDDRIVLREPTRRVFLDTLAGVSARAQEARREAARTDLLLYFSGHADEQGLMLGREVLPYRELRAALGGLGTDVGITILDACASGAITRLKGGDVYPAFLADAGTSVQGYAFLTSSSETEAAQESERLQGSFFTHALLTGLRGAADISGDGRVTLGEAYQFAFSETLAQTTTTQAGAQHPSYNINMAGTGDVVMTDVRETSSVLVLGAGQEGRYFVFDTHRRLVAELYKQSGRTVELGLEPGKYDVYFEQDKKLLASSLELADGQRRELTLDGYRPARRVPTRRRGGHDGGPMYDLLDGRTRVQYVSNKTSVDTTVNRLSLTHWFTPFLGVDLDFNVALAARFYPPVPGSLRPYVMAAAGRASAFGGAGDRPGGGFGGGADLFLGRHLNVGFQGMYLSAPSRSLRWRSNVGVGWTFGRGRPR